MSDIQTYLQQILDAVYGEEVRGSIHDAISTMNSDLESAIQDDLNPLAFKGNLGESGGTNNNLNNLIQTDQRGIWRLLGGTTYTNVPSDFINSKQAYLIMYAFGTSGYTATVIKQEIHYFSDSGANANTSWSRVYLSGEWQPWHKNVDDTLSIEGAAADAKAVRNLKDSFNQKWLNSFSERTSNAFDYTSATILDLFWNTTNNKIARHGNCRSVLIPVSSANGDYITITRPNNGRLYCILLPFDDPSQVTVDMDVSFYTKYYSTTRHAATFNINSTVKSVFLWYYFADQDTGNDPNYVLSHIMVSYAETEVPFEPYNAIDGFQRIQKSGLYGNPDFNSWDYMQNCISFIRSSDGTLMNTPIGDNANGAWVLRCEVFKNSLDQIYVLQTAYIFDYVNGAGNLDRVEAYQRYRLYNRNTDQWDESSLGEWRKIKFSEDTAISDYLTNKIVEVPYPWSQFTNPTANGALWITDYTYTQGTVETVKLNISSQEDIAGYIVFINPYDGTIMEKIDFTGHGELLIDVNVYFGNPFYLGICAATSYFTSGTYHEGGNFNTRFIVLNNADAVTARSIIDFSQFSEEGSVSYCLAQAITYASIKEEGYSKEYSRSHNNLYVIGDSITAGHNSYVVGNHWWEAIAREYGYEVKLGARTGAGMSYYNGTNAPKIVTQQDLSDYDVILIAFGTNDYGNNQELGTIDDEYIYVLDSSQTFYAAAKYTVQKIKEKNPYATIIFSLPINRNAAFGGTAGSVDTKWAYGYQNAKGYTLNDYCEAIINVCNKYGLPYIDHRNGAYDVFSTPVYLYDGLHPSVDGYKVLGCEMIAKFGAIIRPYPEYDGSGGPDVEHNQY